MRRNAFVPPVVCWLGHLPARKENDTLGSSVTNLVLVRYPSMVFSFVNKLLVVLRSSLVITIGMDL